MNITIAASLFFILAWGYLFLGGFRYQKSKEKLHAVTWIGLLLVLITCYHVAVAGVIQLVHIPVNLVSLGIADLMAGTWFWYQIFKKKEKQSYEFKGIDMIFSGTLLLAVAVVFFVRFRGSDLILTFTTIDPAAHLKAAMDVVENQYVQNMYYSALENGLLIRLFGPFFKEDYYYKIFVLSEIYHLALAALVFYGAIRRYLRDRFLRIGGYLLTFVYLAGYPLNSMTYGFVYLGLGVTVVCAIVTLTDVFLRGEMKNKKLNIFLLCLMCYGIFECYVLFMPITFFAVITGIFVKQYREKELVSKDTVLTCLGVFLVPCIFGFYYTYAGIFTEAGITVSAQITAEGACYRDLYSNFIPILPLAMYGIYQGVRAKENNTMHYLFLYGVFFILGLFGLGMLGKASSYYYYKNYNLLWMLVFYLAVAGLAAVEQKSRSLMVCYGLMSLFTMGMYLGNMDARIATRAPMFDQNNKGKALNDLLSYNKENFKNAGYPESKLELYHYVYDNLLSKGEELVPIVCYWEDDFWYQGVTNQRLEGYDYNAADNTENLKQMQEDGNYVLVLTDNAMYENSKEYYDSLEKIYENEIGFVAIVK